MSAILPVGCNPFTEEEEQDNFFHHRESRILSEQEYKKYYGAKDKVETGIIDSDYYDTDEESESEDEYELFRKLSIKKREKIKQANMKKEIIVKNKIEKKLNRIEFIN